ncbi:hypothetical protein D0T84_14245 [Dysgonomonas sp. 521]|nr:hypothetical protein [Dysgonomonas sp. 521]
MHLIALSAFSYSQTKEKLIAQVCDTLMFAQTNSLTDNCIYDKESGFAASCFQITGNPEWISDFNGDGEDDLLIYFMDEGLGGGGNAFGYNYIVVLMKNRQIYNTIDIFGGGKFSYGFLQIDEVKDNKIYATYEENPMSRGYDEEDDSPLNSVNLVFSYKDGMIVEESYSKCPVADMDKRIFKSTTPYQVERTLRMNDHFEQEQTERLYFDKDKKDRIYATFEGCRDINLSFSYSLPYMESILTNRELAKENLLSYISVLEENTRYSSTLKALYDKVKGLKDLERDESGYNIVQTTIPLNNNWEAYIVMNTFSDSEGRGINIMLRLMKNDSAGTADFWSRMKR